MKANPNIDELLSSFLDGELPPRQHTEVQRMVARDPEVGRRLRQLQSCKTLIASLPRAEAPAEMFEQVKLSLERKTLLEDQPVLGVSSAGARRLMARRLVAAAAMIALLGVLGAVVYQIVAPVPGDGVYRPTARVGAPRSEPGRPAVVETMSAEAGFTGRLEIRTAAVAQADAVLKRAVQDGGLSNLVQSDDAADVKTYKLAGSRQAVNRLIADLGIVWHSFEAATLSIEGPGEATPVTIEALTHEQAVSVVAQGTTRASIETARHYAVVNAMMKDMPGREVLAVLDGTAEAELAPVFPKAWLTKRETPTTTLTPPQGEPDVSLTIVLLRTR